MVFLSSIYMSLSVKLVDTYGFEHTTQLSRSEPIRVLKERLDHTENTWFWNKTVLSDESTLSEVGIQAGDIIYAMRVEKPVIVTRTLAATTVTTATATAATTATATATATNKFSARLRPWSPGKEGATEDKGLGLF
jgi:hypothetical protein